MRTLSTTSRASRKWASNGWIHAVGYGILLSLLGYPVSAGERLNLDTFSVYPPQPKIDLDLDDGSTCSVTDRVPPTLVFYGRQLNSLDQSNSVQNGSKSDIGGGVALMIPLGGSDFTQKCTTLLKLQEGRAKIALANQLLEAGQISDADMKKIIAKMRGVLGL